MTHSLRYTLATGRVNDPGFQQCRRFSVCQAASCTVLDTIKLLKSSACLAIILLSLCTVITTHNKVLEMMMMSNSSSKKKHGQFFLFFSVMKISKGWWWEQGWNKQPYCAWDVLLSRLSQDRDPNTLNDWKWMETRSTATKWYKREKIQTQLFFI